MGTPPIFLAGTQGERIESDTSISLCGLPLFFVGTLLVAPKLPAMLRGTAETEFCATLLLCDFAGKIRSI